ncbi:ABC transporter substrate-binding protein [Pseudaminobacter sp. 19-2017]|uniref:ABC transporter substrate-binding protein n=1 Tax=Pseudaminobacter soli (ex Zhang et al. 2022) TaxID=2831468 RepID=A0A942E405_9HYPH|nr:ABC transporter substrate-binding protein [Pseudaminobacter soli]MBS3650710.1 ABC transporter substrate-binding protein [Pseudaminobacter soli]
MTKLILPHAVTRRGLLKGAAAVGAAGLLLPGSMGSARAEPKKGGVFRVGIGHGSTTDGYDPAVWDNLYAQTFAAARHNQLIEVGADGNLVPEIAESWESSDAKTWVFKIRQGVSFHSGKTVTIDDVIASINHHLGEKSTSAAKPYLEPIADMKADGQNLVVTLKAPNADFPYIMSDYHLPIMPATDGKIDPTSSDGCGPYIVESYEPGVQATLNRNANYWKTDRAHFDQVVVLVILDSAARLNALMTGEVDAIDQVEPSTIPMLESRGVANIVSVSGNAHYCFPMDARAAPFSDNNVRLALKYAFDRQELVDKILNGHGSVSNDNPIGPASRYFFKDMEPKGYDPDKAKSFLKKAGMDNLEVTLVAADAAFAGAVDAAVLISEKAAAAGITITVDRAPNDAYWDNVWLKKPFCASYWGGRAVEDQMFSVAYTKGAAWNESYWDNARFEELLVAARSELDEAKRREMYYEMQKIVSFEGSTIIPMYNNYVMGLSKKLATPEKVASDWNLDGFRCVERWWFT